MRLTSDAAPQNRAGGEVVITGRRRQDGNSLTAWSFTDQDKEQRHDGDRNALGDDPKPHQLVAILFCKGATASEGVNPKT